MMWAGLYLGYSYCVSRAWHHEDAVKWTHPHANSFPSWTTSLIISSSFHSTYFHIAGPCPFLHNHLHTCPAFKVFVPSRMPMWYLRLASQLLDVDFVLHEARTSEFMGNDLLIWESPHFLACCFCNLYQTQQNPVDGLTWLRWGTVTTPLERSKTQGHSGQGQAGVSILSPSER